MKKCFFSLLLLRLLSPVAVAGLAPLESVTPVRNAVLSELPWLRDAQSFVASVKKWEPFGIRAWNIGIADSSDWFNERIYVMLAANGKYHVFFNVYGISPSSDLPPDPKQAEQRLTAKIAEFNAMVSASRFAVDDVNAGNYLALISAAVFTEFHGHPRKEARLAPSIKRRSGNRWESSIHRGYAGRDSPVFWIIESDPNGRIVDWRVENNR